MAGGRVDKEWLSSTRPGGDACIVQLCWHPPRAVWKTRSPKLHRGIRTVLVFVRGSRRSGAGAPSPIFACSSGADGLHAYDERCPSSTTTSTPTQPLSSTSSTSTSNASTSTTGAVSRAIWTRRRNVCRCRYVLSRFVSGNGKKTRRLSPHHSSTTLISTVRHSDGAVTSESRVLHTGFSVIHQALKRKLRSREEEERSATEWAV